MANNLHRLHDRNSIECMQYTTPYRTSSVYGYFNLILALLDSISPVSPYLSRKTSNGFACSPTSLGCCSLCRRTNAFGMRVSVIWYARLAFQRKFGSRGSRNGKERPCALSHTFIQTYTIEMDKIVYVPCLIRTELLLLRLFAVVGAQCTTVQCTHSN